MRRTILSENQYDAKFVADGEEEADHQAAGAAERLADEQQQRAHRAEQQRRLHRVVHESASASALSQSAVIESRADERRAVRQRLDLDVFVKRVRAVADRAESV